MSEGSPNPQINISKIPGGTGIAGALFALGSMLIFLIGVPRIRYFFLGAIILGGGIAILLRFVRRETPGKPWILPGVEKAGNPVQPARSPKPENLNRKLQALATT